MVTRRHRADCTIPWLDVQRSLDYAEEVICIVVSVPDERPRRLASLTSWLDRPVLGTKSSVNRSSLSAYVAQIGVLYPHT